MLKVCVNLLFRCVLGLIKYLSYGSVGNVGAYQSINQSIFIRPELRQHGNT